MPTNYANAVIYSIRSFQSELVYIGSTTQPLSKRLAQHRYAYRQYQNSGKGNKITSFKIVELSDAYIELIERFPCNDKAELLKQEGKHIRNTPNCCNKIISGRTDSEWREDNREKIQQYYYNYYAENAEKLRVQKKNLQRPEC